jgi:hypothetical protein
VREKQRRQELIRSSEQPTRAGMQLVVGQLIEGVNGGRSVGVHKRTLHPDFQGTWRARCGPIGLPYAIFSSTRPNVRRRAPTWRQRARLKPGVETGRA